MREREVRFGGFGLDAAFTRAKNEESLLCLGVSSIPEFVLRCFVEPWVRLDLLGRGHSVSLPSTTVCAWGWRVGDAVISSIFLVELAGEPMMVRAVELMFMLYCGRRLIAVASKLLSTVLQEKQCDGSRFSSGLP